MSLIDDARRELLRRATAALEDFAPDVGDEAQRRAPVGVDADDEHPGELRESLEISAAQPNRHGGQTVRIAFTVPYAAVQHERADYHHERGESKFLERAVQSHAGRLAPALARAVKR